MKVTKTMTKWTPNMIDFLKKNYLSMPYKDIAKKLGLKTKGISYKVRKLGLLKGSGTRNVIEYKYNINHTYFDKWNHNMAYILGFISADGHINTKNQRNRLAFGLAHKDIEILKFIQKELCPNKPIKLKKSHGYNKQYNMIHLTIDSKHMIRSIINKGLDNKKLNNTVLQKIPKKYKSDFIRGVFDGDGCIYIAYRKRGKYKSVEPKCTIVDNTYNLLNQICQEINIGKVTKCRTWYVWSIQSLSNVYDFYKIIYQNKNGFYLKRKKNKFKKLWRLKQWV